MASEGRPFMGRRVRTGLIVRLWITAIASSGSAQTDVDAAIRAATQEATRLCSQAHETDEFEKSYWQKPQSIRVQVALLSEWGMWQMLVEPSTPYLDRLAIAYQGSNLVSPANLPRLWLAVTESERLRGGGVDPSPCEFLCCGGWSIGNWPNRKKIGAQILAGTLKSNSSTFLERKIDLQQQSVEYPLTVEARQRAPWVWQMKKALRLLMDGVNRYYWQPEHYPTLVAAAWQWQPSNWYEASTRANSLMFGPDDVLRLQTLLRLALTETDLNVAARASQRLSGSGCGDNFHFAELVHVAQIVALQQTDRETVAAQAAFQAEHLASSFPCKKPIRTATAVLAVARWATDHRLDAWHRYYSYASAVSQMVEQLPFQSNRNLDPQSPEVAKRLTAFERWFVEHQESLERQAASERSRLNSLARELGRTLN